MFTQKLLSWYSDNGRQLPWRETSDPYFIWLSEIILQQTRIEQGLDYYHRFVTDYPTIHHLAAASEQQVLKSWQGLGYYSRARHLHAAARYIVSELNGCFPDTYDTILRLPGVGRYTAAAIASFAFHLPYPVIDGNVYRFAARYFGLFTPIATTAAYSQFEQRLRPLIDSRHPDLFNQAIMDFGSLQCRPSNPACHNCIFQQECFAFREGKVEQLPVRQPPVTIQTRHFYYIDVRIDHQFLVCQRPAGDIWQGLYEFPLIETPKAISSKQLLLIIRQQVTEWLGAQPLSIKLGPAMRHQLTHRTIQAQFLQAKYVDTPPLLPQNMRLIEASELKTLPISRLIDRYLSQL